MSFFGTLGKVFTGEAFINGVSTIASSALGAASTAQGIRETNASNLDIARENREWQERMENTRFQRAKADALAAGFNPILATGMPAGTPMPATPVMQNPKPNRGELFLSTAKALADVALTKELVRTERSKQLLNLSEKERVNAEKDRIEGGEISNPLFGRYPIRTLQRNVGALSSSGAAGLASGVSNARNLAKLESWRTATRKKLGWEK